VGAEEAPLGKDTKAKKHAQEEAYLYPLKGGQMPLLRRVPKRGFTNARFKKIVEIVNIKRLGEIFNEGDAVSKKILIEKGVIKGKRSKKKFLLKVLGNGPLTKKLIVSADLFSKAAAEAIENIGGQVILEST